MYKFGMIKVFKKWKGTVWLLLFSAIILVLVIYIMQNIEGWKTSSRDIKEVIVFLKTVLPPGYKTTAVP